MASSVTWNGDVPRPTRRERAARARRRRRLAWGGVVLALALVAGLATSAAGMLAWTVSRVSSTVPTPSGPPPAAAPAEEPPAEAPEAEDPETEDPEIEEPETEEPETEAPVEEPVVEEPVVESEPEAPVEDPEPTLTVRQVQDRLRGYGFLIGAADGRAGQQTTAAVMAYQRVNGLAVDGVVGPATTAALLAGNADAVLVGGPDDRIEVDLDRQLLHLVEDGARTVTLQVSSGSGQTYTNARGQARARTPVGEFVVERRVHGVREAALGTLYDPLYFYRGFAIHGSGSVPAYPASHGCIRISMADAAWLIQRIPDGLPVHVHGGTHVFTPGT